MDSLRYGKFYIPDIEVYKVSIFPKCTCGSSTVAGSNHSDYCDLLSPKSCPILQLFGQMIITRAEHLYHRKGIEYYAWSMLFDEVPECEIIPEYQLSYDARCQVWTAKRLN